MRYLDTSSLVALYYPEPKTSRLIAHLTRHPLPLIITQLHELEFRNGLQLKLFRQEATDSAVEATLEAFRSDAEAGVLQRMPLSWHAVFETALKLSGRRSRTHGTRSLDLLHVGAALVLHARDFITGDKRQADVAESQGLKVFRI